MVERTVESPVIWDDITVMWRHCNECNVINCSSRLHGYSTQYNDIAGNSDISRYFCHYWETRKLNDFVVCPITALTVVLVGGTRMSWFRGLFQADVNSVSWPRRDRDSRNRTTAQPALGIAGSVWTGWLVKWSRYFVSFVHNQRQQVGYGAFSILDISRYRFSK